MGKTYKRNDPYSAKFKDKNKKQRIEESRKQKDKTKDKRSFSEYLNS